MLISFAVFSGCASQSTQEIPLAKYGELRERNPDRYFVVRIEEEGGEIMWKHGDLSTSEGDFEQVAKWYTEAERGEYISPRFLISAHPELRIENLYRFVFRLRQRGISKILYQVEGLEKKVPSDAHGVMEIVFPGMEKEEEEYLAGKLGAPYPLADPLDLVKIPEIDLENLPKPTLSENEVPPPPPPPSILPPPPVATIKYSGYASIIEEAIHVRQKSDGSITIDGEDVAMKNAESELAASQARNEAADPKYAVILNLNATVQDYISLLDALRGSGIRKYMVLTSHAAEWAEKYVEEYKGTRESMERGIEEIDDEIDFDFDE